MRARLTDTVSRLIGHSGVGKSTLVNKLVPDANRAVGVVSGVGKGRHTSTQAVALRLPEGGWVVDTPGIRSFGLAHITPDDIVKAFPDFAEPAEECPPGCGHLGSPEDPGLHARRTRAGRAGPPRRRCGGCSRPVPAGRLHGLRLRGSVTLSA